MADLKEFFYYIRNANNEPIITVCLLLAKLDNGLHSWFRGIAICSPMDQPNKKIGRSIASGRAKSAWERSCDITNLVNASLPIQSNKGILAVTAAFQLSSSWKAQYPILIGGYKRIVASALLPMEAKILESFYKTELHNILHGITDRSEVLLQD